MSRKVYLLKPDSSFGTVKRESTKINDIFSTGPHESWALEDYRYTKSKFKHGDFFYFSGKIGLNPTSLTKFKEYLLKYGQLLPINILDVGERNVYYVTNFVDCFDFDHSLYRNDAYFSSVDKKEENITISGKELKKRNIPLNDVNRVLFEKDAALFANKITSPFFFAKDRIHFMGPYVTSGFFPENEEFYALYNSGNFSGIKFIEINLI